MSLTRRYPMGRAALVCVAIVAAALTVAGCTRLVAGRAVLASPRVGEPVRWEKCQFTPDTTVKVPDDARCGSVAVPVDYNDLDGPNASVAQLALIRFPATRDKIGSLVINPGGPGESGIEAA
ncbi:MAG: alpha/beta hydrolase, partial [Mycobacterium sp.]